MDSFREKGDSAMCKHFTGKLCQFEYRKFGRGDAAFCSGRVCLDWSWFWKPDFSHEKCNLGGKLWLGIQEIALSFEKHFFEK